MDVLEIKTQDELEAWFQERPLVVAQVVAARAALRALPYIVEAKNTRNFERDILLPVFWALTTSWVARKYPTHDVATASAAATASAFASHAADLASRSADFAAAIRAATYAAYAASDFAIAAAVRADSARSVAAARFTTAAAWKEILQDCVFLEEAIAQSKGAFNAARDLAGQRLWLTQSIPEKTLERWNELKGIFSNADDNWQVWWDWYQARLDGGKTIDVPSDLLETFDVGIATLDEEFWKQGPAVINAEAWRLMDEVFDKEQEREAASPKEIDEVSDDLEQRPSISTYRLRDGKVVAEPFPVVSDDVLRDALRTETLQKAKDTLDRLQRTQAPEHVIRTIQQFIEDLGASIEDVNPGRLLMRARALDAIWAAFKTEEYRKELIADAYVMLDDLVGSVSLFKATYPEILKIEAAQVAQQLARDGIDEVRRHIDQVIEVAEQSELVDETAKMALKLPMPMIKAIEASVLDARTDQARAEVIEKRVEAVSQFLLEVRNFSVASLKAAGTRVGRGALSGLEIGSEKVVSGAMVTGGSILAAELVDIWAGIALFVSSFSPLVRKAKENIEDSAVDDVENENDDGGITST